MPSFIYGLIRFKFFFTFYRETVYMTWVMFDAVDLAQAHTPKHNQIRHVQVLLVAIVIAHGGGSNLA